MLGSPAAAAPLAGGGALLVVFPDACAAGGWTMGTYMYKPGYYPSIYLVDSASDPQRIEYHFSDVSLRDPNSRVHLVSFETRRSSFPIRDYRLLARYRWRNSVSSVIPGLIADPALHLGYVVTVLPVSALTKEEIAETNLKTSDRGAGVQTLFDSRDFSPLAQAIREKTSIRFPVGGVGGLCQPETKAYENAACDKLRRTFGIPVVDGAPSVGSVQDLLPYAELRRRPDFLIPLDSRGVVFNLTRIDDVTPMSLFGDDVEVDHSQFYDSVYFSPEQQFWSSPGLMDTF
jgi:hypothetical protein